MFARLSELNTRTDTGMFIGLVFSGILLTVYLTIPRPGTVSLKETCNKGDHSTITRTQSVEVTSSDSQQGHINKRFHIRQ